MAKDNGKSEAKKGYEHYIPPVRIWPDWYKNFNFVLITSIQELKDAFKDFNEQTCIAFDTETSSLDPEEGFIVGYSFCMDGKTAYYVPVNHYIDTYNLGEEALDIIYYYMCRAFKVFTFNQRFDFRFMEYHGYDKNNPEHTKKRFLFIKYDMSKVKGYDVSNACWLADTNIKNVSLKWSTLHFLGIQQQHFKEVTEGVENFYYTDPKDSAFYGASDSLGTFLLVPATMKYYKESNMAGKIDNKVLYPLQHYEAEKINLDYVRLSKFEDEGKAHLEELEKQIYKEVGRVFNLNSPGQVSDAFASLGIDTGVRTKTGMSVSIDLLEELPDHIKENNPALAKYIEYKQLYKAISSYISVLKKESQDRGFLRCNYKTEGAPTGRLASGKDEKNTFFSEYNIQSTPKPHPAFYYVVDHKDRTLFSKARNIICGYELYPCKYIKVLKEGKEKDEIVPYDKCGLENCIGVVESTDPHLNIRSAFKPSIPNSTPEEDDEWIWSTVDFSGQELRLAANFSHEPVWCGAFKSGGDVHKETAYSIWGKENYDKEKRKMAKGANFSIIYGASGQSFEGMGGMTLAEAEEFFENYKKGLPTLFAYQDRLIRRCIKDGIVCTYFGRPRRVKYYFQNGSKGFGKRTILNDPIQGTAGDILKIVMCKLWVNILNNQEYKDDVRFLTTVHDEIDFGIRKSRLIEILRLIELNMRFELPEREVPLEVTPSWGWNWGSCYDLKWNEQEHCYMPKLE